MFLRMMDSSKFFKAWVKYYNKNFFLDKDWDGQFLIANVFKQCLNLKDLASVVKKDGHGSGDVFYCENICLINISSSYIGKPDSEGYNDHWAVIRGFEPCGVILVRLALEWHGEDGVYMTLMEVIESELIT